MSGDTRVRDRTFHFGRFTLHLPTRRLLAERTAAKTLAIAGIALAAAVCNSNTPTRPTGLDIDGVYTLKMSIDCPLLPETARVRTYTARGYPDISERLPDRSVLTIIGSASATLMPDGLAGPLQASWTLHSASFPTIDPLAGCSDRGLQRLTLTRIN